MMELFLGVIAAAAAAAAMGIIVTSEESDLIFKIIHFTSCTPWSSFKYNSNYYHK